MFICAGAQLALPGTGVDVFNATASSTGEITCATGVGGAAIDPECEDFQQACSPQVLSEPCSIDAPGGRAALAVVRSQF